MSWVVSSYGFYYKSYSFIIITERHRKSSSRVTKLGFETQMEHYDSGKTSVRPDVKQRHGLEGRTKDDNV